MPWARASGVWRGIDCPSSLVLPRAPEVPFKARDEAAAWGSMVHRWKATLEVKAEPGYARHEDQLWERLANMEEHETHVKLPGHVGASHFREHWWPSGGVHEMAFAVDTRKWGRVASFTGTKEQVDAWAAGLGDEWVKGEGDYIGEVMGDPWVDDLKTGRFAIHPKDPQLCTYALGKWLTIPSHRRPGRVVTSVTHWPRYPKDKPPHRAWATLTVEELRAFWETLHDTDNERRRLLTLPLAEQQNAAIPGDQCLYCPCIDSCPSGQTGENKSDDEL